MGVLDIFSGEPGRNTAIWGAGNAAAGANKQRGYINTGVNKSLAALAGGNKAATGAVNTNYAAGLNALTAGKGGALAALAPNAGIITSYGERADDYYQPLGEEANRGYSTYGDAAGVNGAAGQDRARDNFRAGPGYEFTVNEGVNAAARAANATGMGASGNTLDATTRLGANLADKEWDDYMAHLAPYLQLAPGIAGKRADIATGMSDDLIANNALKAGIETGFGKDAASLKLGQGNTLASLASGLGSNQSNIYTGQSTNLSNITGAETGAVTGLGTAGMQAGQQGNANAVNAGMQFLNLIAGNADKVAKAFA